MERQDAGFASGVIRRPRDGHEACRAGNRDDVAVVVPNHGRQEFFDCPEVGKDVHLEAQTDLVFWPVENRGTADHASVINEYGWIATMIFSDRNTNFFELGRRGYVAIVEERATGCVRIFRQYRIFILHGQNCNVVSSQDSSA